MHPEPSQAVLAELASLKEALAAEQAARIEAERRLEALERLGGVSPFDVFAQAAMSVQVFSPDGRSLYANAEFERLFGVTQAFLDEIGYNILQDEQLKKQGVMGHVERGFRGETVQMPAVDYVPRDEGLPGNRLFVESLIFPVKAPDGAIQAITLVHQEVTPRVMAERMLTASNEELRRQRVRVETEIAARTAQLAESERRLRDAQRVAHVGSWEYDLATRAVTWSEEMYRVCGRDPSRFAPSVEGFLECVHPDDRAKMVAAIEGIGRELPAMAFRYRILHPNGDVRTVAAHGQVQFGADAEPLRLVGTVQDVTEQDRLQRAFADQTALLTNIIGHAPAGLAYLDLALTPLWANPAFLTICGRTADELLNRSFFEALPHLQADLEAPLHRVIKTAEPHALASFPVLYTQRAQNDEAFWDLNFQPVVDGGGQVQGVLVMVVDVSARREKEKLVQQQAATAFRREQEFRALVENSPDVTVRYDRDGNYLYFSPSAKVALGISAEEFLGRNVRDTGVSDELVESRLEQVGRVFAGEELVFEWNAHLSVGWRHLQTRMVPERALDGQVVSALAISRDITALKRAEAELRQQGLFMQRLVDHVPAGVLYLDRAHTVRWANPAYERFLRLEPGLAAGKPVRELVGEEAYERLLPLIRQVMERGEPLHMEGVEFPSAPRTHWDIGYLPVFGEDGAHEGLLVFVLDATARVRRQHEQEEQVARLLELDRLKDQFLGILSHELRTPLNAILGFATIIADGITGPISDDQARYMERIISGTEVLLALINDLLDMSRIQAGKFTLAPKEGAIAPVLHEAADALRDLAASKQQALEVACPDQLPTLRLDDQRIHQVLVNLLSNAIKFCDTPQTIRLVATARAGDVLVEVIDQGPGIPDEHRDRLFLPFTQLDMSATRKAGGTGLGLSIAKALVEAHGGQIGVTSAPGAGATFWFTLPRG